MSVKLYNLSGLPDEPMLYLLNRAKRLAGCAGNVVVKVTRGGQRVTSRASKACGVARWFLSTRIHTKASGRTKVHQGHISTDGGYVVMQPYHPPTWALRNPGWSSEQKDPLYWAQRFFEVAIHEFHHVKEFQNDSLPWSKRGVNGRRPAHDTRPEEIRAYNATEEALERVKHRRSEIDEAIIQLAIQMEAKWGPRTATPGPCETKER